MRNGEMRSRSRILAGATVLLGGVLLAAGAVTLYALSEKVADLLNELIDEAHASGAAG